MLKEKLTILGAGNMGSAITTALIKNKVFSSKNITVVDKNNSKLKKLKVKTSTDAYESCQKADIIFLAIKPQDFPKLAQKIKPAIKNQLIVSIMAGVPLKAISYKLKADKIIRSMPNLAAFVGEAMTAWVAKKQVNSKDKKLARQIFQSFGQDLEVKNENLIDSVTAISGSGPAYVFYFVEQISAAAKKLKLTSEQTEMLVKQTLLGSLKYWHESNLEPESLRRMVTSKKGTTEACLKYWQKKQIGKHLQEGIKKAYQRSKELSK